MCFIVMEYMDCGSLDKPLWFSNDPKNLWLSPWTQRIQILADVRVVSTHSLFTYDMQGLTTKKCIYTGS